MEHHEVITSEEAAGLFRYSQTHRVRRLPEGEECRKDLAKLSSANAETYQFNFIEPLG